MNSLAWVVPGPGSVSFVADACCRAAKDNGYDVRLLSFQRLDDPLFATARYPLDCLDLTPPFRDAPKHFFDWVRAWDRSVVFLNSAEAALPAVAHLPPAVRVFDVIHGMVPFQYRGALRHEPALNGVVAVSEATAKAFRNKLRNPERVSVVYNGLVLPEAVDAQSGEPRRDIVFLGGSGVNKGAADLLEIWPALIRAGYGGTLHWCGTIEPSFAARLAALPENGRIVQHGKVDRDRVYDVLARAGALIMASRSEAFGLVVVEGLSLGAIPVVLDVSNNGVREIVGDDYPYLVAPQAPDAFARALLAACAADDAERARLRGLVEGRFTTANMWTGYRTLIEENAAGPEAERPRVGSPPGTFRQPLRLGNFLPGAVKQHLAHLLGRYPEIYRALRTRF